MKIVCGAPLLVVVSSRSRALRGEGRLALRKGEGEGLLDAPCANSNPSPQSSPLAEGRGGTTAADLTRSGHY